MAVRTMKVKEMDVSTSEHVLDEAPGQAGALDAAFAGSPVYATLCIIELPLFSRPHWSLSAVVK